MDQSANGVACAGEMPDEFAADVSAGLQGSLGLRQYMNSEGREQTEAHGADLKTDEIAQGVNEPGCSSGPQSIPQKPRSSAKCFTTLLAAGVIPAEEDRNPMRGEFFAVEVDDGERDCIECLNYARRGNVGSELLSKG